MARRRLLLLAVLATLLAPRAEAIVVTDPVSAPAEPCHVDLPRYYLGPPAMLDCPARFRPDQGRWLADPNCGRLIPTLRGAARTKDAQELLLRAALEYYAVRRPELIPGYAASVVLAQAQADLAVTGREAYASFSRLAPAEAPIVALLAARLRSGFPAHVQVPGDVTGAVQQALHRAYEVAWALRGPTWYRTAHRDRLGWIAVDGEDDPPHRPVNVPSAPYPQRDMIVRVGGIDVLTRYMVASLHVPDNFPFIPGTIPPEREHPLVSGDVIVFIPGHSSSVEEADRLAEPLFAQAEARGRPLTLIAMDLPSNGYASMIEHTTIAPSAAAAWNTGYPILDFYEKFIVAFVDGLEARQPGIKSQIVGVIGGSLGGNLGLRLARRDPAANPWLRNVVSWSPASVWESFGRAVPTLAEEQASKEMAAIQPQTKRRFFDLAKLAGVVGGAQRMDEAEGPDSQDEFFNGLQGRVSQADHWYSKSWPCREDEMTTSHRSLYEIYNSRFRRWHWRVGMEQLIYSHWDSENTLVEPDPRKYPPAGPARYSSIRARLLFASGKDDDNWPEYLSTNAKMLADSMTMIDGSAFFVAGTGHSIHTEKPAFFAGRILDFLFASPAPPFPAFLIPAAGS